MENPVNYPAQDICSLPVLCFDLDGTLLDNEQRIHPADAAFLQSPQRAWLVPTTGRPLHSVKRTFSRHRLFSSAPLPFPLVLQNGAVLYGPGEKVLEHRVFEEGIQGELINLFKKMPYLTFYLIGLDSIQVLWPDSFGIQSAERFDFLIKPFEDSVRRTPLSKLMCLSEDPHILQEVAGTVGGLPVETAFSMNTIFEITPLGVDKGSGLERLLAALGISNSRIYTAGDGENDLSLFQLADLSFAPMTAPTAIRQSASRVIEITAGGLLPAMISEISPSRKKD